MTATDIAKALQTQGFNVLPGDVNLPGRLDRVNNYTVQVKFAGTSFVQRGPLPSGRGSVCISVLH